MFSATTRWPIFFPPLSPVPCLWMASMASPLCVSKFLDHLTLCPLRVPHIHMSCWLLQWVGCDPINRCPGASLSSLPLRQLAFSRALHGPVCGPSYCGRGGRVTWSKAYGLSFGKPDWKMRGQKLRDIKRLAWCYTLTRQWNLESRLEHKFSVPKAWEFSAIMCYRPRKFYLFLVFVVRVMNYILNHRKIMISTRCFTQ